MKIVCGALAALLFCVAGAIWYVYQKKAVFLPALFGLCGFPKIKESCYYDGSGHFRPATKEDKVGFLCSIQSLAAFIICSSIWRITR